MATFPEVCLWELSYVNVPTVNIEPRSMNAAIRTLFRRIILLHRIARTHYMYQLLNMINQ